MATKKIKRFEQGGMTDKERGLAASKDDKVGFFERLRMGNIDQEGSEAYKRLGAGRGKAESVPVEDRVATTRPTASKPETESTSSRLLAAGAAEGSRKDTGDANVAEMYSGPRTKPIESSSPAKTSSAKNNSKVSPAAAAAAKRLGFGEEVSAKQVADAKAQLGIGGSSAKSSAYPMTGAQPTTKTYDRSGGPSAEEISNYKPPAKKQNYSNEGRGKEMTKKQQAEYELDSIRPTAEQTQKGLETATTMMGGAGLKGLHAAAKNLAGTSKGASAARTPAQQAYDRAQMAERLTPVRGSAAKPVKEVAEKSTKGAGKKKKTSPFAGPAKEDAKADKAYQNLRDAPFTTSARDKKTLNPLSWMSGPKGMADDFKKGGKVKVKKMASGGSVSSPSKRGDGIASRGKTNCKMR
jgi:hypothetical protein